MKTIWIQTLAWLAAAIVALLLAFAGPNDASVMGKLPSLVSKRIDRGLVALPDGLPATRTLALVAFSRNHREEIDSWIHGLALRQDASIAWVRIPVLDDPGDEAQRSAIESRIQARHHVADHARLLPVFTDRAAFLRSIGMSSTDHAWALVLDREGTVLAKAEGRFDQDKAQALRETLLASNAVSD